jgi:hypothetical protein
MKYVTGADTYNRQTYVPCVRCTRPLTAWWSSRYGSDPGCRHLAPNARFRGPGKIAFPSQVQIGMFSFLFGGAQMALRSCAEMGRGSTGNIGVGSNALGMWAMDISGS